MWYRVLVGMMGLAVACCVAWMVWAGAEIVRAEAPAAVQTENGFSWNNGVLDVQGTLDSYGVFEQMTIRRLH